MSANPLCLWGISEKSRAVALMQGSTGLFSGFSLALVYGLIQNEEALWIYCTTKWPKQIQK